MYTYDTRVGFSQVDTDRVMKIEALTALFQDVTCFQGEELGVGFDYLEPKKMAWLLTSWQIDIKRLPKFNEKITAGTFPTSFKSFIGNRNFFVKDECGEMIVKANSVWTFMDMEKLRPAKIDEKFHEVYPTEEVLPMEYLPRKIDIPATEEWTITQKQEVEIREYHLDSNNHVNNGQYVQMAMVFLPKDKEYNRFRVEYRKQAVLGDKVIPLVYEKDGCFIVALCDEEKSPYAILEASKVDVPA